MKNHDIYLYGMTCCTTALLLREDFPKANCYSEVKEKHFFTGGETGGAATILASLGCKVKIDGNHTGTNTDKQIQTFYNNIGVDVSRLHYDPGYAGIDEIIIIDKETRTTFGTFAAFHADYWERGICRWNEPVEGVKAAGIDPWFHKQSIKAAEICRTNNVPFVTIDERYGHEVCKLASIIVISSDWIRDNMPEYLSGGGKIELLKKYMNCCKNALVIITSGGGTAVYGRNGEIGKVNAHKIVPISTLGAGDTFKAACIYGLSQEWSDEEIIKFSMACAAVACMKFPLPFNPPTVAEVEQFIKEREF